MSEKWKDIPGYEGWYQISDRGNVRRVRRGKGTRPGLIRKPVVSNNGYKFVTLSKNGEQKMFSIHHLACMTFHGPRPDGYTVNHKDGDRSNNAPDNLEWITLSDNVLHAFRVLGKETMKGERHGHSRLTEAKVRQIRKLYASGKYDQNELSRMFNIHQSAISRIINRKRWDHTD